MTTLEDLYYGNINPFERAMPKGSRMAKASELLDRNEQELTNTLTEQQKEMFNKFKDCYAELEGMTEVDAFKAGFILAIRIMMEATYGMNEVEDI